MNRARSGGDRETAGSPEATVAWPPPPSGRERINRWLFRGFALFAMLSRSLMFAQTAAVAAPPAATSPDAGYVWSLSELLDRLPELLADRLPGFDPYGAFRLYVQPHFGDFLHSGYVLVPVGARAKITDRIELNAELQSYFAHGSGPAVGDGMSALNLGVKVEHVSMVNWRSTNMCCLRSTTAPGSALA